MTRSSFLKMAIGAAVAPKVAAGVVPRTPEEMLFIPDYRPSPEFLNILNAITAEMIEKFGFPP